MPPKTIEMDSSLHSLSRTHRAVIILKPSGCCSFWLSLTLGRCIQLFWLNQIMKPKYLHLGDATLLKNKHQCLSIRTAFQRDLFETSYYWGQRTILPMRNISLGLVDSKVSAWCCLLEVPPDWYKYILPTPKRRDIWRATFLLGIIDYYTAFPLSTSDHLVRETNHKNIRPSCLQAWMGGHLMAERWSSALISERPSLVQPIA